MWTGVVVAFLGLFALALFTPLDMTIDCERSPRLRFRLGFRWMFGLVKKELEPRGGPAAEEGPAVTPGKKRRKSRRPYHVAAMLTSRGFLRSAARLAKRLTVAFRIRDIFVWLRAGFEDPADTGHLCGLLMPAASYLQARHPGHWDMAPVFSGPTLGFSVRGRVSVTPVRLLWPLLAFGLSPSAIRGFIALRTGKSI